MNNANNPRLQIRYENTTKGPFTRGYFAAPLTQRRGRENVENCGYIHCLWKDPMRDCYTTCLKICNKIVTNFFLYFRISKNSLYELLSMNEDSIRQQDTVMREAISSDQRLALTRR
ncbi:hypothetical protein PR048_015644 [Dryococelus australis]|uniref:Uncharacterized protein n=1 Tax=Dryococelus australis TaxID=614101 RepID=A0ABQ9HHP1_9NEOP|nr:hypothetical protein PR048_015644 [Dryococelus australis]